MLAGPGGRMGFARDSRDAYFARKPVASDRDYLEHVFHTVAALPGCAQLFDPRHNLIWKVPISADAARAMVEFWRRQDPQRGSLVHDFTDPDWDTRFLGDLYQDLSERAREEYGLCQTPPIRRSVYSRSNAYADHRGVRLSRGQVDRSGLRLGPFSAWCVRATVRDVAPL